MTASSKHIRILLLISALFLLPGVLAPRGFWVADETRYAEVLREMLTEGQWLVPHLNDHFYPDKPPLFFWLCSAFSTATGSISVFSCMLVTWLTALGCILATYRLARRMAGPKPAFISALLMQSTFLFLSCAQIVRMDMMMAMFVVLAIDSFYTFLSSGTRSSRLLFYVYSGLAIMSKGPLGFAFTFLPAIAILMQRKQWKVLRRFVVSWEFLAAPLLPGLWFGAAWATGNSDFIRAIFVDQIVGRSVKGAIHSEPFYFYILLLPLLLLPWSPFLVRALRNRKKSGIRDGMLLTWWFCLGLITISAVSGKLFIYLLPILPPVAILLGSFLNSLIEDKTKCGKAFVREVVAGFLLLFGVFAVIPFAAPHFPETSDLTLWPLAAVFIPVLLAGTAAAAKGAAKQVLAVAMIAQCIFSIFVFHVLAPQVDDEMSGRTLSAEMAQRIQEGEHVATCGLMRGILNFYAEEKTDEITHEDAAQFLSEPGRTLITAEKTYRHLELKRRGHRPASKHHVAFKTYVVIPSKTAPTP